jgi:anti-anti-sigma factor
VQNEFRVEVHKEEGATVIAIAGELDLASAPQLEEELERAQSEGPVTLDLRELEFMDSTGLSILVRAHQAAEASGHRLLLVQGPPQVQRLLSLTGVAERLNVVDALPEPRTKD